MKETRTIKLKTWAVIPKGFISSVKLIDLYDTKKEAQEAHNPNETVVPITISYPIKIKI